MLCKLIPERIYTAPEPQNEIFEADSAESIASYRDSESMFYIGIAARRAKSSS